MSTENSLGTEISPTPDSSSVATAQGEPAAQPEPTTTPEAGPATVFESSIGPASRTQCVEMSAEGIVAMDIKTTAGNIVVDSHDQPRIIVYAMNHDPELSQLDVVVKGDTIHIEIKHLVTPRWIWSRRKTCATSLRVMGPRGLLVSARSGAGDIQIIGATEDVDAETGSGNITLNGTTGHVSVRTGSGNVSGQSPCESLEVATESGDTQVEGLAGSLSYKSSTGGLKASWARTPTSGKVDIKTGKGPVALVMPGDTRLNYRFITGPTPIMNEFEHEPGSAFRLNVVARSGSLSVRKAR